MTIFLSVEVSMERESRFISVCTHIKQNNLQQYYIVHMDSNIAKYIFHVVLARATL